MGMFKQASSRNQRGRGHRVKNTIKIFILVAICIWLLYQVKHSHDQKRAFEERSADVRSSTADEDISPKTLNIGRKVLPGPVMQRNHEDEAIDDEEEPNVTKPNGNEDDDRGTGDDRLDENDLEKILDGADHGDEQQIEDGREGNLEESGLLENQGQNILEANSQEAREKHYNEDDASSAVVRDTQTLETEGVGEGSENFAKEQPENTVERGFSFGDSKINGTSEVVGTDTLPFKTEHPLLNETLAIKEKQMENIESEATRDRHKSNTSMEINTSGTLQDESGDHRLPNGTLANSTISKEDGDRAISNSMPPPSEMVEVNSTEVLLKNLTESQDNGMLVVHEEATGVPFENATLALDSSHKMNSTIVETKTNWNESPSDGKVKHVKNFTSENAHIIKAPVMESQENSTISSASSLAVNNSTTFSMEPANSTDGLHSQEAPVASGSIHEQNSSSTLAVTDEGRNHSLLANGSSHVETTVTVEGGNLNPTGKPQEPGTSLSTAAEQNLQGGTRHKPPVSPSNISTVGEDKGAQIHLPSTQDGGAITSKNIDTAVV